MLYELRKYEVMPGKVPALLNRFSSFTVPKWQEYGIRLVGFWTPEIGGHNQQLIYAWAWESHAERVEKFGAWRADPERARVWAETQRDGPLVRRVHNLLMDPTDFSQIDLGVPYGPDAATRPPYVFELREYEAMPGRLPDVVQRFRGFTCDSFAAHGFRQVGYWTPSIGDHDHLLVYILAWESVEERNRLFGEFRLDPERRRVFAASEENGPIVERVNNVLMNPTAFSPMR